MTICTHRRECLFGEVVDGKMVLNPFGRVVATYWQRLPRHFPRVELGAWVVMPNHVHGIIIITDDGDDDITCRGEAFPQTSLTAIGNGNAETPGQESIVGECLAQASDMAPYIGGKGEVTLRASTNVKMREGAEALSQTEPGGGCFAPTGDAPIPHGVPSGSVGAIVGNVKSTITRRINQMRHTPGAEVWQRNYWEHIVRTPEEHARIEDYIRLNPARWHADDLHPDAPPNPFNQER